MSGNAHFSSKQNFRFLFIFSLFLSLIPVSVFAVTAEKDIVDTQSTSSVTSLSKEELEKLPVNRTYSELTVIGSRLPSFKVPFSNVPANVSYIPANVSQKGEKQIHQSHPQDTQQALNDLEGGIFFDNIGNGVDTTYGLRGFSDSSSVIVLVDGVRMNELDGNVVNYALIPTNDIEAIQLDRGSASPIFGSNAFAGVLHITTRRPNEKKISLFGGLEFASHDGLRFNDGISGTLPDTLTPLDGNLTYYFNMGRNVNDGFRDNGEFRITSLNSKVSYEFAENKGNIHAGVKHIDDATSNPGSITFEQYQADPKQTLKPHDGRAMSSTIVDIGADRRFFDDKLLASILASHRTNRVRFRTTFATFTDFADGFDPDTNEVNTDSRTRNFVWQLAYQDNWDGISPQSILGFEILDGAERAYQRDAFGGIVRNTALETDRDSRLQNAGLYWRETLDFWDRVIAHAGMRHDWHWLDSDSYLPGGINVNKEWNNSSVSTGVTGKPLDWFDIFMNYSQGYRVPTISEVQPFGGVFNSHLMPEKSHSFEFGDRVRIKEKAQIKSSWFLIDMEDEIAFDSTSRTASAPFGQNINIGKSRRYGFESRMDLFPIQEVNLYGSHTWTKAYVRETDGAAATVDERSLGQVPEHRFTMGTTISPLKRLGENFEGFTVGFYGTFTGKQHPSSFETTSQASLDAVGSPGHLIKNYSIWDFLLSYRWRTYEIYFKITNLFDEKHYSNAVTATSFGTAIQPAGTFTFVNPGAPREYALGMRWEIG